jgi:hypothetical protein
VQVVELVGQTAATGCKHQREQTGSRPQAVQRHAPSA